MYITLLSIHSLVRWFVLLSLIFAVFIAFRGWLYKRKFSSLDHAVRKWTVTFAHIQFVLGFLLYTISPISRYFLHHFKEAIHLREIRFFGMEHSFMMLAAVFIITIGSAKAKSKLTSEEKFKTMAIWFSIGLFAILTSIPWAFSPLISRPYFRPF
jgi:hypothetical protein